MPILNRNRAIFLAIIMAAMLAAPPVGAQSAGEVESLRGEIETLKKEQQEIRKQLDEIKKLLQRGPVANADTRQPVLQVAGASSQGSDDAPVTLIEFSDYQCSFCRRFALQTMPTLIRDYVKTGKVKHVYRDFPIARIHPQATEAAVAARCAGEQGKYWQMHDRFFTQQNTLKAKNWPAHAAALGLDGDRFQSCMGNKAHFAAVKTDIVAGRKAGVRGTPTFFLGLSKPGDKTIKAIHTVRGARPYADFKAAIDGLLKEAGGKKGEGG